MIQTLAEALASVLSVFPLSFFAYSLSERMIARHESRVGKKITMSAFIWQTWVDNRVVIGALKPAEWLNYLFELSVVALYGLDFDFLIFPYLAIKGFILSMRSRSSVPALDRISSDREQVAFAIAAAVAGLSLMGAFTLSRTTNMSTLSWSFGHLVFIVPFQLAGMILFGEAPFVGFRARPSWIESARFYAWCMLTAKVFLGGGDHFVDLHAKAVVLFLCSRIIAIYFPSYRQKDLLRVSILYLFPITGVLWLLIMLARAWVVEGGYGV